MNRIRVAAIVGAGMMFVVPPASAGLTSVVGPQLVKPDSQVEQIRYRRNLVPEAIIGGVIFGVLGGVLSGNCYFNDCGMSTAPTMATTVTMAADMSAVDAWVDFVAVDGAAGVASRPGRYRVSHQIRGHALNPRHIVMPY